MQIETIPPARLLGKRGDQRLTYSLKSLKMSGPVLLESAIEVLGAMACEIDTRVQTFRAQPFTIELNTGLIFGSQAEAREQFAKATLLTKPKLYTPDLLVNEATVFECKSEARIPALAEDLALQRAVLTSLGYSFCILTDQYFRADAMEQNLRLLFQLTHRLERRSWAAATERVRAVASDRDECCVGELARAAKTEPAVTMAIVLSGDFTTDLRAAPISPQTLLTRNPAASLCVLP